MKCFFSNRNKYEISGDAYVPDFCQHNYDAKKSEINSFNSLGSMCLLEPIAIFTCVYFIFFFHCLVTNFLRNIDVGITHTFKELLFKQDAAVTFLSRYFNHKRHITWIDVVWTPILGRNFTS